MPKAVLVGGVKPGELKFGAHIILHDRNILQNRIPNNDVTFRMLITVFWCMQRCHLSCPSTFNLSTMAIWAKDKAGQRQLQARLKAVVE